MPREDPTLRCEPGGYCGQTEGAECSEDGCNGANDIVLKHKIGGVSADAHTVGEKGLPAGMNTQTTPAQLKSKPLKVQGIPKGSALSRSGPTTGLDGLGSG
jgi:hypothetical protein